jgi:uroporphyrinogen-III synthase
MVLPRGAVARDVLPRKLRERWACVDVVEAYRTMAPEGLAKQAGDVFSGGHRPDWITFTSSSTVQNFVRTAGAGVLRGVKVASIGPVTSATAKKLGLQMSIEAKIFTSDGLVAAILETEKREDRKPGK